MHAVQRLAQRIVVVVLLAAVCLYFVRTPYAAERPDSRALEARELAKLIDRAILDRLQSENITPSPVAGDAEFMRRAYLDITGVIPTADQAAAFLNSSDPNKRTVLIDELLASPKYGRHFADIWQGLLVPVNSDNRRLDPDPMGRWLEERFNSNQPWDRIVYDLLVARGTQEDNGAVTFFVSNPTADKMTDAVTRLFLGIQLQCAQCHNHPFTTWKQTDYWGLAAFFLKVQPDRVNAAAKNGKSPGVRETPRFVAGKKNKLPESAKILPARFLTGETPPVPAGEPHRPVLAKWLAGADNPYFAKAMVNRMWAHFFGRGFVNPVDNIHDDNPASHPELFKTLAVQFKESGFDLKYLVRAICNSDSYQRSSKPAGNNAAYAHLFAHMNVKTLMPEQLFDCLMQVTGIPTGPLAQMRMQKKGPNPRRAPLANLRANFATFFRAGDDPDPTEYEAGIPQALRLMNSPLSNRRAELLEKSVRAGGTPEEIIAKLYLGTVSRQPTPEEKERLLAFVQGADDRRKAYTDVLWVLLNCSEFTLNH